MTDEDAPDKKISQMFKERLESELAGKSNEEFDVDETTQTRAYEEFKAAYLPKKFNIYEQVCNFAEKTLPLKPDSKKSEELQKAINICHLNTTPTGVYSAAVLIPLGLILTALILFFVIPLALGLNANMFFVMFFVFAGLIILIPLQKLPMTMSSNWKMKASNQMVLAVFYMVTYMRHTSNLELAVNFASEHLSPPLALDLRKLVWNVETEKFDSISESIDDYLENWRFDNPEFVECMNLIKSSLYEPTTVRRLISLDKSLSVMLDGTYEKMLHFAHNLKAPLTTLNMMGVVLPILTLVLLPLVVSFMDNIRWYHLLAFYDILLPIGVYYLGQKILATRPGGSGEQDITKKNPELKKYKKIAISFGKQKYYFSPAILMIILALIFVFIGLIPVIWHGLGMPDYGIVDGKIVNTDFLEPGAASFYFLNYREGTSSGTPTGNFIGPFGLGALLLSLLIPLGIGYFTGLYFKLKSKNIMKIRNQAKKLELEFSSALFQLGSRIGDGIPAETAFGKVASMMGDTVSGKFFMLVHVNITRLGMSVHQAIFDKEKGALQFYPSDLIESSMKVLVESSRKGPLIASQALINVSEYIKQMHRVDERLKDLMGDVISSLKGQVKFLTPVISGIVIGITSMITKILGILGDQMGKLSTGTAGGGMTGGGLMEMFGTGIPTYHFQIVVGLYVVELAYILTVIGNGIETGGDKIGREYDLGSGMTKSVMLYFILSLITILVFNIVSASILPNINLG